MKKWSKIFIFFLFSVIFFIGISNCKGEDTPSTPQDPEPDKPTLCEKVIEAWKQIEEYPYVWGGQEIEDGGFDCSGAMHWVSKMIGKPIPRTTSKKYYLTTKGKDEHWKNAECGVYWIWWTFSPDRPYGHIGWHTKDSNVWQSGSSTGPTEIQMWENNFWDKRFKASKKVY